MTTPEWIIVERKEKPNYPGLFLYGKKLGHVRPPIEGRNNWLGQCFIEGYAFTRFFETEQDAKNAVEKVVAAALSNVKMQGVETFLQASEVLTENVTALIKANHFYEKMPEDWASPDWQNRAPYRWTSYVGTGIKELWPTFTDDQKQALSRFFQKRSDDAQSCPDE